eukprot:3577263-Amphidinium_carterae.3
MDQTWGMWEDGVQCTHPEFSDVVVAGTEAASNPVAFTFSINSASIMPKRDWRHQARASFCLLQ